MSLQGIDLQVVDVFDFLYNDAVTGRTLFSGVLNKSSITNKNDKIDIWAGIGQGKISSLKTKKETMIECTITKFDLLFMAAQNGVELKTTDTGTYTFNKSITVTSLAATVTGATKIYSVRKNDGTAFKIISGTPAAIDEVKVAGTALTFYTGMTDATVLVTFANEKVSGKDNLTIEFNSRTFPKTGEFLCTTVAYDSETTNIVADAYINFFSVAMEGDYTWSFDMGKNIETTVKFEVLVPALLPDGTANTDRDTGKMVVTER